MQELGDDQYHNQHDEDKDQQTQPAQGQHGHQEVLVGDGADTLSADDLQLEAADAGLALPLCATGEGDIEDVPLLLDRYVHYFNNRRPAAALGYKSPVQYKTELGF